LTAVNPLPTASQRISGQRFVMDVTVGVVWRFVLGDDRLFERIKRQSGLRFQFETCCVLLLREANTDVR